MKIESLDFMRLVDGLVAKVWVHLFKLYVYIRFYAFV